MDSPAISSNEEHRNQPRGHDPARDGAHDLVGQDRVGQEAEKAAQRAAHQPLSVYPTASLEAGVTS